jgi:hypothetical protein
MRINSTKNRHLLNRAQFLFDLQVSLTTARPISLFLKGIITSEEARCRQQLANIFPSFRLGRNVGSVKRFHAENPEP